MSPSALATKIPPARGQDQSKLFRLTPASKARRPALAAGSAAIVVLCAVIITSAFSRASSHVQVLVASRAVAAGSLITTSDITTVSLSGSGHVSAYSPSSESALLGHTASVPLRQGEVIPRGVTTAMPVVGADQAVVGMSLTVDQLPAEGLSPGELVEVVEVAPPGAPASNTAEPTAASTPADAFAQSAPAQMFTPGTVVVPDATVYAAATPRANSSAAYAEVVSLVVPSALSNEIVTLAAAKQIGLALIQSASGASGK